MVNCDDELEVKSSERGLISKMIERGKILMKSIPKTGAKIAGQAFNFIPTPETLFKVGKQTLIGLPQEIVAYAVNSFCIFFFHDIKRFNY